MKLVPVRVGEEAHSRPAQRALGCGGRWAYVGWVDVRQELADYGRLDEDFAVENQHWYEGPWIELQEVRRPRPVDVDYDLLEGNPELRESDIGTVCPYMVLGKFGRRQRNSPPPGKTLTSASIVCVEDKLVFTSRRHSVTRCTKSKSFQVEVQRFSSAGLTCIKYSRVPG